MTLTLNDLTVINGLVARIKQLGWRKQQAIRDGVDFWGINQEIANAKRQLMGFDINPEVQTVGGQAA